MVESYTEKLKHFCNLLKHNMFSLTVMNHKTKFFFQNSDFGFQNSDFGFQNSDFNFQVVQSR